MLLRGLRVFRSRLSSRAVIHAHGPDAQKFLQGLVTADLRDLIPTSQPAVHTAFLNPRGRVAFDAIVSTAPSSGYYLDVHRGTRESFLTHLKRYKLRAKVTFHDLSDKTDVWAVVGNHEVGSQHGFMDPRLNLLGRRIICEKDSLEIITELRDVKEVDEEVFVGFRVLHGVAEGEDFAGEVLPLEFNLDMLGKSVSFGKGCYLGQELTARSHHTGVLRKRLVPLVTMETNDVRDIAPGDSAVGGVEPFPPWVVSGQRKVVKGPLKAKGVARSVGTVKRSIWNIGLAVVRLDSVFGEAKVGKPLTMADGNQAIPWKPGWWPQGRARPAAEQFA